MGLYRGWGTAHLPSYYHKDHATTCPEAWLVDCRLVKQERDDKMKVYKHQVSLNISSEIFFVKMFIHICLAVPNLFFLLLINYLFAEKMVVKTAVTMKFWNHWTMRLIYIHVSMWVQMNGPDSIELHRYYIHVYYIHPFRFKLSSFFTEKKQLHYNVDPSVSKTILSGYAGVQSWYW